MGRRRRESPAEGFLSDVFELCSVGPIWVGPLIAAIVFGIFFFLIPWYLANRVGNDLAAQMTKMPYGIFRNLSRFMSLPFYRDHSHGLGNRGVQEAHPDANECGRSSRCTGNSTAPTDGPIKHRSNADLSAVRCFHGIAHRQARRRSWIAILGLLQLCRQEMPRDAAGWVTQT